MSQSLVQMIKFSGPFAYFPFCLGLGLVDSILYRNGSIFFDDLSLSLCVFELTVPFFFKRNLPSLLGFLVRVYEGETA